MSSLPRLCAGVFAISIVNLGCGSVGEKAVGDSCLEKEECISGLCLQESRWGLKTGWVDGYCTEPCSSDCGNRARCVEFDQQSYCMATCVSNGDCREGYMCDPWINSCLPNCHLGWSCGDAFECNEDGYCVGSDAGIPDYSDDDGGDEKEKMGSPCEINSDCESDYCKPERVTDTGRSWIDGICSQICGSCPLEFQCVSIGESDLCLPNCQGNFDCRDGYVCSPWLLVCLPDCRLGFECGQDLHCSSMKGICGSGSGGEWLVLPNFRTQ